MPSKKSSTGSFQDVSLWFLLVSNLTTIFFAMNDGWNLLTIMWIYWTQSIIIGLFNFIRILQLKEFSTENFYINGKSAQPTQKTKNFTAFFFLAHYGLFHFVYAIFLLTGVFIVSGESSFDTKYIFLSASLFFFNHLFSYFYNKPRDTRQQNIGALMFYPYVRILPMHLTIILGSYFNSALIFFLILKTVADCAMHVVEHKIIRRGEDGI